MKRILFLCTGNYYRSRFAEVLFNHLAQANGLGWQADSRGLHVQPDGRVNVGPLSVHTIQGLKARGIPLPADKLPRQVSQQDLSTAHLIVAVKEAEHRKLMAAQFPDWTDRVRYWHVHDLDAAQPAEALQALERLVKELVVEMGSQNESS